MSLSRFFLVFVTFAAFLLRFYFILLREYPAGDEIWAYFLIKEDFKTIWFSSLSDYHAPLYFLTLSFLSKTFSFNLGINALRLISLFFGVLSVFSIYRLVGKVYGREVARISIFLTLFSPVLIWASIFARYYSFLIFLCTVACLLFVDFLEKGKRITLLFLTLFLVVGIYTHYYFVLLVVSFNLFLILFKKNLFPKFLSADFSVAIFCMPLAYYFLILPKAEVAGRHINDIVKVPASFISNITSWEVLLYIYKSYNFWLGFTFIAILTALFLIIFHFFLKGKGQGFSKLFVIIFFVPLILSILYGYIVAPLFSLSSLQIFLVATLVILCGGISEISKKTSLIYVPAVLFVAAGLFFLYKSSSSYSSFPNDFKLMSEEFKSGDLVLHAHIYSYIMGKYYFGDESNWGIADAYSATVYSQDALGYKLLDTDSEYFGRTQRVWFLSAPWDDRPQVRKFKQKLTSDFELVSQDKADTKNKFTENDFDLFLYERIK